MIWYSHVLKNFPQFVCIHTVKGFGLINKAEVDAFLELSCFFNVPTDVGNLISGSSAFSKSSLNIWKFMVHVLLKPGLENFEHYFARVGDECKIVEGGISHWTQTPYPPEMFRVLSYTLCAPGPRDPTETETELCLVSPEEVQVSSGLLQIQGLWVQ